jgi:hypothetical protein
MANNPIIADEIVISQIYHVRGAKVMFDFDLAALYEVETRVLKQAVKRNPNRFPNDFMFQLSREEWQEAITKCDNLPKT